MSISRAMFCGSHAVMGLDLSLRSAGICVVHFPSPDQGERSFVYETVGYCLKGAKSREKIKRVVDISEKVMSMAEKYNVSAVGIEGYAFGAHQGLAQLGELNGVIKAKFYEQKNIVCGSIPCGSVRKYLLENVPNGSLKAKNAIRSYIENEYGIKFSNNDESDAAAVALVMFDWKNTHREYLQSFQIEILHRLDDAQGRFK